MAYGTDDIDARRQRDFRRTVRRGGVYGAACHVGDQDAPALPFGSLHTDGASQGEDVQGLGRRRGTDTLTVGTRKPENGGGMRRYGSTESARRYGLEVGMLPKVAATVGLRGIEMGDAVEIEGIGTL